MLCMSLLRLAEDAEAHADLLKSDPEVRVSISLSNPEEETTLIVGKELTVLNDLINIGID